MNLKCKIFLNISGPVTWSSSKSYINSHVTYLQFISIHQVPKIPHAVDDVGDGGLVVRQFSLNVQLILLQQVDFLAHPSQQLQTLCPQSGLSRVANIVYQLLLRLLDDTPNIITIMTDQVYDSLLSPSIVRTVPQTTQTDELFSWNVRIPQNRFGRNFWSRLGWDNWSVREYAFDMSGSSR